MARSVTVANEAVGLETAARELTRAGFLIHEVVADKKPGHKAGFMDSVESIRDTSDITLGRIASGKATGMAVFTGGKALYGTRPDTFILTALELEGRAVADPAFMAEWTMAIDRAGLQPLMQRLDGGWREETPSGGVRWFFRILAPDTDYAKQLSGVSGCLSAVRGGKAYAELLVSNASIIVAPSYGRTHPSGKPYARQNGGPVQVTTVAFRELNALSELLREVGDRPEATTDYVSPVDLLDGRSRSMLAQYNKLVTDRQLAAMLVGHGWVLDRTDAGGTMRLSKPDGSAEVAVGGSRHEGAAWTFSAASAAPLTPEKHLRPSDVLAALEFGGDYEKMLAKLQKDGTVRHAPWPFSVRRPVQVDVEATSSQNLSRKIGEALQAAMHPTTKDLPFVLALVDPRNGQYIAPVSLDTEQALLRWTPQKRENLLLSVVQPIRWVSKAMKFQHSLPASIVESALPTDRIPPALTSVRHAATEPVILPNGDTVNSPGYHPEKSALIAIPHRERAFWKMYRVPESPTITDVQTAADLIFNEVLVDFPFETEGDKVRALAYFLTGVSRALYGAAPGWLLDASERGTGKTFVAVIMRVISTGSAACVSIGYSRSTDAETEKAIVAAALEGGRHLHCDELPRGEKVTSKALMEVITAAEDGTRKRILGRSGTAVITPMTVTICGNNAEVGGDSNRRYISIRMVNQTAGLAFERSGFRHDDLLGWVRANRPKLLAALHTILSYGLKHKVPLGKLPTNYGGFEQWTAVVLASLSYVKVGDRNAAEVFDDGRRDFVETNDDEGDEWAPIMEAWLKSYGTETWATARDAHKRFSRVGSGPIELPVVLLPTAGVADANQAKTWGRALSARRMTSVLSDGKVLKFDLKKDPKRGNRFRILSEIDPNCERGVVAEVPSEPAKPAVTTPVAVAPVVTPARVVMPGLPYDGAADQRAEVIDLEAA
ncbi:hypothetical protein [Specibacter sp. RAF43]|uniref:hypothetical protein n=1 Tax=Specibacter sp. RAF43 TaxID=3233057 RepID=UPI003F9C4486